MPYVTSFDQAKIYYHKSTCKNPKGTMMFVHGGFFGNHTILKKVYSNFEDYNIIAPDIRGRGNSGFPKDPENQKLEYYAKDLFKILKNEKINELIIVGASFGGLTTLKFVEAFQKKIKIKKLVLISSTYTTRHSREHKFVYRFLFPVFKKTVRMFDSVWLFQEKKKKNVDFSKLPKLFFHIFYGIQIMMNISIKTVLLRYKMAFKLMDYEINNVSLNKIDFPVLLIHGERDHVFPIKTQTHIVKHIKKSKLELMKNQGHNVFMHNPEEVSKYIHSFLNNTS